MDFQKITKTTFLAFFACLFVVQGMLLGMGQPQPQNRVVRDHVGGIPAAALLDGAKHTYAKTFFLPQKKSFLSKMYASAAKYVSDKVQYAKDAWYLHKHYSWDLNKLKPIEGWQVLAPLEFASGRSDFKQAQKRREVKLLLEHGADPNYKNGALPYILAMGDMYIVNLLLKHGANLEKAKARFTTNDLIRKMQEGNVPVVHFLLENGVDPSRKATFGHLQGSFSLPLDVAVNLKDKKQAEIFTRMLLDYGADADAKDTHGIVPLCHVVQDQNKRLTSLLLYHKADPDIETVNRFNGYDSILVRAVCDRNCDIIKALLDHKADPNLERNGRLPLCMLSIFAENYSKLAKMLLGYGADPDKGALKDKPIFGDGIYFKKNSVEFLLSYGANPNKLCFYNSFMVAERLLAYGANPNGRTLAGKTLLEHFLKVRKNNDIATKLVLFGADATDQETKDFYDQVRKKHKVGALRKYYVRYKDGLSNILKQHLPVFSDTQGFPLVKLTLSYLANVDAIAHFNQTEVLKNKAQARKIIEDLNKTLSPERQRKMPEHLWNCDDYKKSLEKLLAPLATDEDDELIEIVKSYLSDPEDFNRYITDVLSKTGAQQHEASLVVASSLAPTTKTLASFSDEKKDDEVKRDEFGNVVPAAEQVQPLDALD